MAHSSPSMQPSVPPHALDDQPGLEVVPHDELPEVRPEEEPKYYLPLVHDDHKIHLAEDFPEVATPSSTEKGTLPVDTLYQRQKWWIIGGTACVVIAIILGVTLGVVLSLKARSDDNNGAVNATSRLETIRLGSKLSAVARRKPNGDVERYVFYEDPQGQIRRSQSITSKDNSTSAWEPLPALDLGASNGTHFDATVVNNTESNSQTGIFYQVGNEISGATLREESLPNIVIQNTIGGYTSGDDLIMGKGADLAAYWPYIITQDASGQLVEARNMRKDDLGTRLEPDWRVRTLGISAYEGSSLCIVPTSSNFSKIEAPGGYGVIYQKPNQGMAFHIPDNQTDSLHHTFPEIYAWPPQTPSAAFVIVRDSNDGEKLVDIYFIAKGYGGGFSVWYTENSSGWMEEVPAALQDGDEESHIACSSLLATDSNSGAEEVPSEPANAEARCYFQRGGRIVEVGFDGSTWTELGEVLVP
ncbi:hypothetical protein QBC40DRAFT_64169 [Triangularia verruculosa]|uniref:Fucose-specific lectin n=1 Tax=Triangularia verruculosa TaxID=2587418 RepID=A0AAN6XI10_9PEZI|nr:hypothetical protein QBC40DRAFT_64169 [Triangularia verruculosa]